MRPLRVVAALTLVPALLGAWPVAFAADPLTDAIQAAYAPYREALYRTNAKAATESAQAVQQARDAWTALAGRYGAQPSIPYDRDPKLAGTLRAVAALYDRAAREVGAGQLVEAHETLEGVRDLLADLRRRNGVVVFSDHMNAYHARMEDVVAAAASSIDGAMRLMAQVGVLDHLAARLEGEAPPALAADPQFQAGVQAARSSVAALPEGVLRRDPVAVKEALGKLKAPYGRLFQRYC